MNKKLPLLVIAFLAVFPVFSQSSTNSFTLFEVIELAKNQSPNALQAETRRENLYWQYRTYKSNYMPQLSLSGVLPDFNSRVIARDQDDGTTDFVSVYNNNSSLTLSLSQAVGATGGQVFISSDLRRFDDFNEDYTIYSGDPAFIGFRQPVFGFNNLKWDRRIEPLRYEESKRGYVEDMENISVISTQLFFDLLLAQVNLEIATKNLANNDTVLAIGKGRYNLGKIAENDLLLLELNVLNSSQAVSQSRLDLETSSLRLKSYIGFGADQPISLVLPNEIPTFIIDEAMAVAEARKNRRDAVAFKRQVLEAQRNVAQARGEGGFNMDVYATFGFTNSGNEIPEIYVNPQDQQSVRVGFDIPLVDWGRQKSVRNTAEANQKLVQYTVAQEEVNFDQEVITEVKQFDMLREQILITEKADEISQSRYDISQNRYLIGRISITDLNIALQDKDQARRTYISSLRNFWTAYYNLRMLTLYDFATGTMLYTGE